jgi:hypothetical protein
MSFLPYFVAKIFHVVQHIVRKIEVLHEHKPFYCISYLFVDDTLAFAGCFPPEANILALKIKLNHLDIGLVYTYIVLCRLPSV